jgi:hypothetical protein
MNISVPGVFCGELTRSASSTNPSSSRYQVIDKLPKVGCLGLSQRHFAYKGGSLITQATGGGYGRIPHD